jgi:hypothetical protein
MRTKFFGVAITLAFCGTASASTINPPLLNYPAEVTDSSLAFVATSYCDPYGTCSGGGLVYGPEAVPGVNESAISGPSGYALGWVLDQYANYPLLWARAQAYVPSLDDAAAEAMSQGLLYYTVEAVGPPGTLVPLDVQAVGGVFPVGPGTNNVVYPDLADGNNGGSAGLYISYTTNNFGSSQSNSYNSSESQSVFVVNTTYFVEADTPIGVELQASAEENVFAATDLTGDYVESFVDPYFSIDPSFADADLYQIGLSPGVGNEPFSGLPVAVPEPSTWAMLLLAFAGLGFAGYRGAKREQAAFTAA